MSPQAPSLITLDWRCTISTEHINGVIIPGLILQKEMELQPPTGLNGMCNKQFCLEAHMAVGALC